MAAQGEMYGLRVENHNAAAGIQDRGGRVL
jgi:hypothetical protein